MAGSTCRQSSFGGDHAVSGSVTWVPEHSFSGLAEHPIEFGEGRIGSEGNMGEGPQWVSRSLTRNFG